MSELKPCPFCGSTKLKIDSKSKRAGYTGLDAPVDQVTFSVRCNVCHARGGAVGGKVVDTASFLMPSWAKEKRKLQDAAAEAWNRRAE